MASNPFNPSAPANPKDQQLIRRERVKVTVYAVLGVMVMFCLTLLFQGCRHQPESAGIPEEISMAEASVETNSPMVQPKETLVADVVSNQPAAIETEPAVSESVPLPAPVATPQPETPAPAQPAVAAGEVIYVIKRGDSLSRIAKTHGTTVQALKTANQLTSDRILIGKTLRIPVTQS